ncbi:DUF3159 domain-containing protein [Nesterenkonia halobia]|uniref:DUF3159 domain-containing protein n=1 Tax=Nesterenkonia halobia TaxID=37922 RepID=A0ABP6RBA9_9MICC
MGPSAPPGRSSEQHDRDPQESAPRTPDAQGASSHDPEPGALSAAASSLSTRADGSLDVMSSVGGVRGLLEASLPSAAFLVSFVVSEDLTLSAVLAVVLGAAFTVVRLVQRGPLVQSLSGLAAIVLCAVVAQQTGQARDYYLWGFITNIVYILAFSVSIAVRWPFLGILFGLVRGEGLGWRREPRRRRRYALATWIVTAVLALRLVVQVPLYLGDQLVALGTSRLLMGLPLYGLALWVGWMITRPVAVEGTVGTSAAGSPPDAGHEASHGGEEPRA